MSVVVPFRAPPGGASSIRLLALTSVLAFASVGHAEGGAAREHSVGVGLGYGRFTTRDDAASSLVYGANTVDAALEYTGEAGALRWGARSFVAFGPEEAIGFDGRTIRFQTRELDGSITDVGVPVRGRRLAGAFDARFGYVHRLERVELVFGGTVEFAIARPEGFVALGLMQRLNVGPHAGVRLRLTERQRLELEARTSLVGWASRLPYHQSVSHPDSTAYAGFVRQGSSARSFVHQQTVELVLAHRARLRPHFAIRSAVYVSYLRDENPRSLRALSTRVLLLLETVI